MTSTSPSTIASPSTSAATRARRATTRLRRIAAATLVATTAMAATAGVAGAYAATHKTDDVTFISHAYLTPQPDGSSRVRLVADACAIASDHRPAKPCVMSAIGTLQPDGSGVAKVVVASGERVLVFDETFASTGPASGLGVGSVREMGVDGVRLGTFQAPYQLAPTADPNVLLDWGSISVVH